MADEEFMFGDLFATVRVQDLPASREVVAVERQENGAWRVCGSAIANADGIAELGIEGSKTSRVYAFAIDHWGEPFTPNRTVAYGDIIRPSVFLGWLYRVTAPGALPDEEPVWWNSTPGMPRPVGSAMAQAEMYFQPIAHGPVDIEWEDKGEGDPHWDKVVALLHLNGDLLDESTGVPWVSRGVYSYSLGKFDEGIAFVGQSYVNGIESPQINFLADDFTIEVFCKRSTSSQGILFDLRADSSTNTVLPLLDMNADGSLGLWISAAYRLRTSPNTITTEPQHVVLTKRQGLYSVWVSGVLVGQFFDPSSLPATTVKLSISMRAPNGSWNFEGTFDELRITKGIARYTANFTPPTEPFPNFK